MTDVGLANARLRGRKLWFQIHKWIGLSLFIVLIPVSATGSLLVWHDWTDGFANPQRYAVSNVPASLTPSAYADAARTVLKPGARISLLELPEQSGKPVLVTASLATRPSAGTRPGPAARYQVWLDPANARVVDHADPRTGLLRTLHVLHGSLMIPGGWGRPIVGWLGVAMLISCLTGLWLWMPAMGSLARGLRWKRTSLTSANLHHQVGVWIAIPLAILSFTGAYISFPAAMRSVEGLFVSGGSAPRPASGGGQRVRPAEVTALSADQALIAARAEAGDSHAASIRWPTEKDAEWSVTFENAGARSELIVDDATVQVSKARTPPVTTARFMRTLHDGNGYNRLWQTIIFLGGLAPALLGITGFIMWLCTRGWRGRVAAMQAAPAE